MKKGNIVWLNGVSSSGKSTLTIALQKHFLSPYFCIAQDTFTDIIAPCLLENFVESDTLWYVAVEAMYKTIKLYSDLGLNIIVDHVVINDDDGKEQRLYDDCIKTLSNYPLVLVKVICNIEELKQREFKRGDREAGNAEWQFKQGLYPLDGYSIIVDTSAKSTDECAILIADLVKKIMPIK
jgi:chloramphenicol 3-O phosphotransferase